MSNDIFDTTGDGTNAELVIKLYWELHLWEKSVTRSHFRYIYNTYWYSERVIDVPARRAQCRELALGYIDTVILGRAKTDCPPCRPTRISR